MGSSLFFPAMPRSTLVAVSAAACLAGASAFVQAPVGHDVPRHETTGTFLRQRLPERAAFQTQSTEQPQSLWGWTAPLLSVGCMLGLVAGLLAPAPARAITAEQFSQLTYAQVKGSGLANRCPTVESQGTSILVKDGQRIVNMCFEPKSFAVEAETDKGTEFVTTKLTTRQTYTLAFIEGALNSKDGISFKEEDGMDFQATTVKLPDGEYVPFLFSMKALQAKGSGSEFKPGFTWGGEFEVPSYRTGGFLDPKGRGMYTGYDQAVALPALQADGKEGQEELFKETNKVFDIGKGAVEMEVNKVNADLGEIGGVFVSKQPSDTDRVFDIGKG